MSEALEFIVSLFGKGGPIMWPLLLCSIVSVTITIERIMFWVRLKKGREEKVVSHLRDLTESGKFDEALVKGKECSDLRGKILVAALSDRDHGFSEAMQIHAEEEVGDMKQGLGVLDTIVTMAPLLGILGTVLGIIESFDLLHESGIADPKAVTGGIAQALITTAAGLTIALISLVPLNYLVATVQKAAKQIEQAAVRFEVAYRKGCAVSQRS